MDIQLLLGGYPPTLKVDIQLALSGSNGLDIQLDPSSSHPLTTLRDTIVIGTRISIARISRACILRARISYPSANHKQIIPEVVDADIDSWKSWKMAQLT